jgi:prepilin-type N-terminal cleavage/methylation domain-containing protein
MCFKYYENLSVEKRQNEIEYVFRRSIMKQRGVMQIMRVRGPRGFTLVEVLIAIVIFSLSLLALVPLLSTATSIDRENYLNVMSRALAADTLDSLMGLNCLVGTCTPLPTAAMTTAIPDVIADDNVTAIKRTATITQVGNLANIAVTATYTYKGQLKTFILTAQKGT